MNQITAGSTTQKDECSPKHHHFLRETKSWKQRRHAMLNFGNSQGRRLHASKESVVERDLNSTATLFRSRTLPPASEITTEQGCRVEHSVGYSCSRASAAVLGCSDARRVAQGRTKDAHLSKGSSTRCRCSSAHPAIAWVLGFA